MEFSTFKGKGGGHIFDVNEVIIRDRFKKVAPLNLPKRPQCASLSRPIIVDVSTAKDFQLVALHGGTHLWWYGTVSKLLEVFDDDVNGRHYIAPPSWTRV